MISLEMILISSRKLNYMYICTFSFSLSLSLFPSPSTIHWNYCVLDEGHIIKNTKTKVNIIIIIDVYFFIF